MIAKQMDDWFPKCTRVELTQWVPHFETLKPLEWVEVPENCNWKVSIENYSECYHCSLNHPTFASGCCESQRPTISNRKDTACATKQNAKRWKDMTYDINSGFDKYDQYSSWFLWPMFSFQVYPGNVLNTYHWRAVDADHVMLYRGWYSVDGAEDPVARQLADPRPRNNGRGRHSLWSRACNAG